MDNPILKEVQPCGYWAEVPSHIGIARNEQELRVLLDAPTDVPLTQWRVDGLAEVHPRLAGCVWYVVGTLMPPGSSRPDTPFLEDPGPPTRCLRAWLWRITKPPKSVAHV